MIEPDFLVVGAGLTGCVLAERIANDLGASVRVLEKRPHVGGLCHSFFDSAESVEVPSYGTHVFHTRSVKVWRYMRSFAEFEDYRHHVVAIHDGLALPVPFNRETIEGIYGRSFTATQAKAAVLRDIPSASRGRVARTLEEEALGTVGSRLYETLVAPYTMKQYGRHPRELLPGAIRARAGVTFGLNREFYPLAQFQGLPVGGYGAMFARMLDSPRIEVLLGTDYLASHPRFGAKRLTLYTGAIDEYFDCELGAIEYRSVRFHRKHVRLPVPSDCAVANIPDGAVSATRVHLPSRLWLGRKARARESKALVETHSPGVGSDAVFPVATDENRRIHRSYLALAEREGNTRFCGRLASHPYYDMDKAIAEALRCYETIRDA